MKIVRSESVFLSRSLSLEQVVLPASTQSLLSWPQQHWSITLFWTWILLKKLREGRDERVREKQENRKHCCNIYRGGWLVLLETKQRVEMNRGCGATFQTIIFRQNCWKIADNFGIIFKKITSKNLKPFALTSLTSPLC